MFALRLALLSFEENYDPDSECSGNSSLMNELKVLNAKMDCMQNAMEQQVNGKIAQ